jgi:hypothetical protein
MSNTVAKDKLRIWRNDPVQFVRDLFSVEPDLWQVDTLMLMVKKGQVRRRVAMRACT